jgi:hypothetical protein
VARQNLPSVGEQANLGGPAAGEVAARSASLVAAVADASRATWEQAGGVRAQALVLRRRALMLAQRDALDYARARAELDKRDGSRDFELGEAVRAAAQAPLELASLAADVAQLAASVAARGAGDLRADAAIAALLATGAARAAAHLVEINLIASADDEVTRAARAHVETAAAAAAAASMEELPGSARPVGERG